MTISQIADKMKSMMTSGFLKAKALPAFLTYCTAIRRSGMSESMAAALAIEGNRKLGINTGPNPDGTPNLVNQHDYNLIKSVLDTIRNDGVVHVSVPAGSIMFTGTGGNAGGPVQIVGYNVKDVTLYGLIR